ncbi:T9SS type A sorting domain-containing protein [bacterium]|nr:T9SS type A sorting domain-containing protein [bacterium]
MKKRACLALLIFLITFFIPETTSFAEKIEFSKSGIAKQDMQIDLISRNHQQVTLSINIHSCSLFRDPEQGDYLRLYLDSTGFSTIIGEPQLPVIRKFIECPALGKISTYVEVPDSQLIDLMGSGFEGRIIPRQTPSIKTGPPEHLLIINEDSYAKDQFLPSENSVVKLERSGIIRGTSLALLEIEPFHYNPQKGLLKIYNNIRVRIEFENPLQSFSERYKDSYFEKLKGSIIANYCPSESYSYSDISDCYLIIVADEFASEIGAFVDWKSQKGFKVEWYSYSEVGGSSTSIQSFLSNAYESWDIPPTFVLLIGDVGFIPAHEVSGYYRHYTDLYYATVDGDDFLPDLFIGRISVQTPEQLQTALGRIIEYEKTVFIDREWLRRPIFMACGTDGNWELAQGTHRYVIENYLIPPDFAPDSIWAYSGGTGEDAFAAINEGCLLVNYSGHGYGGGWANPEFDISDISALSNSGKYPLVISNACLTGKFDQETCFGEAWIRTPHKGAVAFLGASNSTYWTEDDIFEKRWYDAVFEDEQYALMAATCKANLELMLWGTSLDQYYFEVYNLLGDPATTLYWGIPSEIPITHFPIVPLGVREFIYSAEVENALLCLWQPEGAFGLTHTFAGSSSVTLSPLPDDTGTAILTLTAQNGYETYQDTLPIILMAQMTVNPETLIVADHNELEVYIDSMGYPMANLTVLITGLDVDERRLTNASGYASFDILPPYMEDLRIKAVHRTAGVIANSSLTVIGGDAFGELEYSLAAPDIALEGNLAAGFRSVISSYSPGGLYTVFLKNLEIDTTVMCVSESCEVEFFPFRSGGIELGFAKIGREVIRDTAVIISARGPFNGIIREESTGIPVANVRIKLFNLGADTALTSPILATHTNSEGLFDIFEDYPCGWYDLYLSHFSYEPYADMILINAVGNYQFFLSPRPYGSLTGSTYPSDITVYLNWIETGENILNAISFLSEYSFPRVAYQTYEILGYKRGYKVLIDTITVSASSMSYNINLEENDGEIMIVDRSTFWTAPEAFREILEGLDYSVSTREPPLTATEMSQYNLVIWSTGGAAVPFSYSDLFNLSEYRRRGGKLLIEGAEIPYFVLDAHPEYAESLLFIDRYIGDDPDFLHANPRYCGESFYNVPNLLPQNLPVLDISPGVFDFFDIFTVTPQAHLIYQATSCDEGGCISYFDDQTRGGLRNMVLMAVNLDTSFTDDNVTRLLVENAVEFLLGPRTNRALVYGIIDIAESENNSGVWIMADRDSLHYADSSVSDGRFNLVVPEPGTYQISLWKREYSDTTFAFNIEQGKIYGPLNLSVHFTGIPDDKETPGYYALSYNYPNPFNSFTDIKFTIPGKCSASFKVFDLLGKTLYSENLFYGENGTYRYLYRGEDSSGKKLPTGIYFYQFQSGDFREIRKMLILR